MIRVLQLALRASQLLEQTKLSELRSNIARNLSELEMFTEDGGEGTPGRRRSAVDERMEALVNAPLAVEDALVALFDHSDHTLQRRVIETYVRRLYQVCDFLSIDGRMAGELCISRSLEGKAHNIRRGLLFTMMQPFF
jgi:acetyl-CoA carboxylase/biotin carboxylase 1